MKYNIVLVANEGYMQHAAVMLCSLFETNPQKVFLVYLLTDGISYSAKNRMQELCLKYNSKLIVKLPEKELGTNLGINLNELPVGQWNTMMYYKLFIPLMLPQECERCLFLDVDMIVNDNIEALYNWDLNNDIIAAAEDIPDCEGVHKPRLGLTQTDVYINSGVMVCDLKQWRKMESDAPIFEYVKKISHLIINEQDVIAMYFKNRLSILPIRWNMTTFYFMRKPKIFDKYLTDLYESKKYPGIIHFSAPIKPWFKDCLHPYRKKYKYYLTKSKWPPQAFSYYLKLNTIKRLRYKLYWLLNSFNIKKDPYYLSL